MAKSPSDERLIERLEPIAKKYHSLQQGLVKQRRLLKQIQAYTASAMRVGGDPLRSAYLSLQKRAIDLSLKQMEVYSLDSDIMQPAPNTASPAFKAQGLELELITLQMEHIIWSAFAADLRVDLPRAREGQEPAGKLPPAWLEERAALAADAERAELWNTFAFEVGNLGGQIDEVAQAVEAIPADLPPPLRLAELERLKIPALKGVRFRIHGLTRRTPKGEELLKTLVAHYMPGLEPRSPGKKSGNLPSAARKVTDRLKETFR